MSKESEAKKKQGYVPKATPQVCMNCASYRSEIKTETEYGSTWEKEVNKHCAIGGFEVMKMGTCNEFSGRENETDPKQHP
jgi:hypothetical protein